MAKQTFTAGQVLTAAEMNSLQENDYNWTVTTKTASYTLAAGDEGTRIVMDNAGATTITVDDAIFSAGDVVWIHNIGAGTCTITAGTATVSTVGDLALAQYAGGHLYFTSASAAIFFPTQQGPLGKILQVVSSFDHATFSTTSSSFVDVTGLSVTITPTSATSKVLLLATAAADSGLNTYFIGTIFRGGAASGTNLGDGNDGLGSIRFTSSGERGMFAFNRLDSPATTSATTYNFAVLTNNGASSNVREGAMTALEVSA